MQASSRAYLPEALDRMTTVLGRATQELNLASAPTCEKERLAACILSVGNTYSDVNRLHEKSVRLYLRSRCAEPASSSRATEAGAFF